MSKATDSPDDNRILTESERESLEGLAERDDEYGEFAQLTLQLVESKEASI